MLLNERKRGIKNAEERLKRHFHQKVQKEYEDVNG